MSFLLFGFICSDIDFMWHCSGIVECLFVFGHSVIERQWMLWEVPMLSLSVCPCDMLHYVWCSFFVVKPSKSTTFYHADHGPSTNCRVQRGKILHSCCDRAFPVLTHLEIRMLQKFVYEPDGYIPIHSISCVQHYWHKGHISLDETYEMEGSLKASDR